MESRQFVWSLAKLVVVVKHLADQKRHNNAYSGQAREKAYEMDIAYYASCDEFTSANVTKRQLHGKEGLYDKIYGHAAALRSQLCELGKERTEIQMSLKTMGISAASLSKCSNLELSSSRQEIFDGLISIANEQERQTENPANMTQNELTIHRSRVENERKKRAKQLTLLKKIDKASKADEKYALGNSVIDSSDAGKKRKRSSSADSDTGDESGSECMSAAYWMENKVPVEHQSDLSTSSSSLSAAASKKRKASPPKQSRILSQQEIKAMYPNLSLKSEDDDEDEDDVVIQRKESKASVQMKTPLGRKAGSRASTSNGISGVLSELKSGFMSIMTPVSNGPGSNSTNRNNSPVSMSILTRALNAFDAYASNLSVANALKFKRSLSLPNLAEMFLQFNDAERQEHIQEVLESNSVLML